MFFRIFRRESGSENKTPSQKAFTLTKLNESNEFHNDKNMQSLFIILSYNTFHVTSVL